METCKASHNEKYAFRGVTKGISDLTVEIEVTDTTGPQNKARLAADWALQRGIHCRDIDFDWVNFADYVCPQGSVFAGSLFTHAVFEKGLFEDCSFAGCRFVECRFQHAKFVGCDFTGSTFVECSLGSAAFTLCDFSTCSFDRCDLIDIAFDGCAFDHIHFAEEAEARYAFEHILTSWTDEIPQLIVVLKQGLLDGGRHGHDGADLMATLHRLRGLDYKSTSTSTPSAAERWFMALRRGDKAGDSSLAGYVAQKAVEWAQSVQINHAN